MKTSTTGNNPWPKGTKPLAAGVTPPGFTPVTEEILVAITQRIVEGVHPEKVILFGSYVYGSPSEQSDVDLLIIMNTNERPVDRYVAISRLLRPRPFPLDIVVKTPQEIGQAVARNERFIQEILGRGRVLYDRAG